MTFLIEDYRMKNYWKLVGLCALPMPFVGFMLDWVMLGLSASAAVLLAGWAGIHLGPKVPLVRSLSIIGLECPLAVAIIVGSGLVLGVAGWLQLSVLWGVGLFGVLVLPLADYVNDINEHKMMLRAQGF
jgi:hypothetical protein